MEFKFFKDYLFFIGVVFLNFGILDKENVEIRIENIYYFFCR